MTTSPDPRPAVRDTAGAATLDGRSCSECDLHTLSSAVRCPSCRGAMVAATFGPVGVVWSSTVVRVPVPGRTPPYAIAYVDLDQGPRVLCHLEGLTDRAPVGSAARLIGATDQGDVMAEVGF